MHVNASKWEAAYLDPCLTLGSQRVGARERRVGGGGGGAYKLNGETVDRGDDNVLEVRKPEARLYELALVPPVLFLCREQTICTHTNINTHTHTHAQNKRLSVSKTHAGTIVLVDTSICVCVCVCTYVCVCVHAPATMWAFQANEAGGAGAPSAPVGTANASATYHQ
jgi:hypothetical protein